MYGNWSKKDITTRIELLNSLTIHTAKADWSNWPKTITITVDGKATTHKTLRDAMHTLMDTDPFYEDREPETTTTEIEEEEIMNTTTNTVTYHGKQVPIYGGAWNDSMNSCFYDVIGSVKDYDICRSTADGTIFALSNPMAEDEKEEEPVESANIELTNTRTFEREGGRSAVTITKLWRRYPTDNWALVDDDHTTWYRKPEWDENGKIAYYTPDSVKGQRILMTEQELNDMINNTKEDTTMKTTETTTFELGEATYTMNPKTNRYSKTENGKTKRIGKAEYDEAKIAHDLAWAAYEQEKLDAEPSRVEVENDLEKPAVLNENGCVDCSKCNCDKCVHRDCMRRNPKTAGGLGECPRLDNGILSEAQKIAEETGMELAEAELEANIRNEQKKPRKARKSKDVAYEGNGVTLTAKQVDFLLDLKQTDQWDGFDTMFWTDVICDEIEGQFAGKPMTVGAMISTLCEKGLAERSKGEFTDPTTGRTRKSTYMAFTGLGQKIAEELGI